MTDPIQKTVHIHAHPARVWQALTETSQMHQWMADPGMQLQIATTWEVGTPIVIRGLHSGVFENKGTVRALEPVHTLAYDYVSSISQLPDIPQSRTTLTFFLRPEAHTTILTLTIRNFPTEAIYRHVDFYWNTTLTILKQYVEHNDERENFKSTGDRPDGGMHAVTTE